MHSPFIHHSPKNSLAAPFLSVVCENLWRARKLLTTNAKSLPRDRQSTIYTHLCIYLHQFICTYVSMFCLAKSLKELSNERATNIRMLRRVAERQSVRAKHKHRLPVSRLTGRPLQMEAKGCKSVRAGEHESVST